MPKGDLRAVSIIAIVTGVIVSAVAELDQFLWIQLGIWALAVVSFVLGILSLNARMARELAAAGFIAGVAAFLLSISIGLFSGALFLS